MNYEDIKARTENDNHWHINAQIPVPVKNTYKSLNDRPSLKP